LNGPCRSSRSGVKPASTTAAAALSDGSATAQKRGNVVRSSWPESPEKRAPRVDFRARSLDRPCVSSLDRRAATVLVHRRRPTARRIVSPFPLQNRPAVSGVPIATSSARFSTRRFTICGTKRIHNFGIRAQFFMGLRGSLDARRRSARGKIAGGRKSGAERPVGQPPEHAPTTSLGQFGGGDPIGMGENFARHGQIIGRRAPLSA